MQQLEGGDKVIVYGWNRNPDWEAETKSIFGMLKDWNVDTQKLKDELRNER